MNEDRRARLAHFSYIAPLVALLFRQQLAGEIGLLVCSFIALTGVAIAAFTLRRGDGFRPASVLGIAAGLGVLAWQIYLSFA